MIYKKRFYVLSYDGKTRSCKPANRAERLKKLMFAVINQLHLSIPVDKLKPGLELTGIPLLESLPGFHGIYFVKHEDDRATVILLWDSAADAENGAKAFGPTWFAKNIAPFLASDQQRSVGEVIVKYQK